MTVRFYLVPAIGTGASVHDSIRPKYVAPQEWAPTHGGIPLTMDRKDFGWDGTFLVGADVTPAQHSEIVANADVTSIPQNIDANVGANLNTVQTKLEALSIPADWITSTMSYRVVIRFILKLFQLISRYTADQAQRFFANVTLDTTIAQLTAAQRNALNQAAQGLGLDTSTITGSMALRQALRILLTQLPSITLMGQVF